MTKLRQFAHDETGNTAIEYGLIVAVLSLAMIGGFNSASNALNFLWGSNESKLNSAWHR